MTEFNLDAQITGNAQRKKDEKVMPLTSEGLRLFEKGCDRAQEASKECEPNNTRNITYSVVFQFRSKLDSAFIRKCETLQRKYGIQVKTEYITTKIIYITQHDNVYRVIAEGPDNKVNEFFEELRKCFRSF